MSSSRDAAEAIADLIRAVDPEVRVTTDVRNVVPPCVLVEPPTRTFDLPRPAYSATWRVRALAPAPANADAWDALDRLVDVVDQALDVDTAEPAAWVAEPGAPPLPCYTCTVVNIVNP